MRYFLFLAKVLVLFCLLHVQHSFSLGKRVGVLLIAHGGDDKWNMAVEEMVVPLRSFCRVEISFGMAHRGSLQEAVQRLEKTGVTRIAAVRLFISPDSFRHQTEYFLGTRPDPPVHFIQHDHSSPHMQDLNTTMSLPLPIRRQAEIILNREGLYESPLSGQILVERVQGQSVSPEEESILVLAHGEGDDRLNQLWLRKLNKLADSVRKTAPFRVVRVETLREDWNQKRAVAERTIRQFVEQENSKGGRVIVVPFRIFGFGPYREVLQGLQYVADGKGLLPHPSIRDWIKLQAADCFSQAGWENPFFEEGET